MVHNFFISQSESAQAGQCSVVVMRWGTTHHHPETEEVEAFERKVVVAVRGAGVVAVVDEGTAAQGAPIARLSQARVSAPVRILP